MPELEPSCKICEYVIDPEINPSSYIGCQMGTYPFPILNSVDITKHPLDLGFMKVSCKLYRKEKNEALLEAG